MCLKQARFPPKADLLPFSTGNACTARNLPNHIFEDGYTEIMRQTTNDLHKRLMIDFEGQDGLDYYGLARFVPA
jgi:hypothetical protein